MRNYRVRVRFLAVTYPKRIIEPAPFWITLSREYWTRRGAQRYADSFMLYSYIDVWNKPVYDAEIYDVRKN